MRTSPIEVQIFILYSVFQVGDLRVPPTVSHQATQLRHYLTKLQSTIDSIITGSESSSEVPEVSSSGFSLQKLC